MREALTGVVWCEADGATGSHTRGKKDPRSVKHYDSNNHEPLLLRGLYIS